MNDKISNTAPNRMNTKRKGWHKERKGRHYYSVRHPGDPVWHPLDHITYIRLDEKDSKNINGLVRGGPVVIEKSRKREERVELRRVGTTYSNFMWEAYQDREVDQRKPQVYQNLEPYQRSPEGMKKLIWQNDEHKNLSFIPANTHLILGPFANPETFFCYDVTNGPSDEELVWPAEPKIARRIVAWFSKEHFDLSVTKHGTEYDIRPIHKYYRGPTHISDKA